MQINAPPEDRAFPHCGIAVMAKASKAGRTKTRLGAVVGPEQAALLNTAFLKDIAANLSAACEIGSIASYVAFGPPEEIDFFDFLPAQIARFVAWEPTFGETLKAAIRHMLTNGHDAACVLNSDSPTLPSSILVEAARSLAEPGDRIVLGPSNDGGYYLLGMKTMHEHLFADITWSTEHVTRETLQRAADLGLDVHHLPQWYDVDDALSFEILRAELSGERAFGPPGRDIGASREHAGPARKRSHGNRMTQRSLLWLAGLAALTIAVEIVLGWSILPDSYDSIVNYLWVEVPIYAVAVIVVLRDKGADPAGTRRAVALILVVAAALRVMAVPVGIESTDINRYVWDGRVQGAGINPYGHIPAEPALAFLRDDEIYPEINRKDYAPTIYPPFAQIVFFLTTRVSEQLWVMKSVMVGFDGLTIWALMRLLKARHIPPTRILLYAWHPVPIWEFAADGHIDSAAVCCMCLALLSAEGRRPVLAGIALGAATLTKVFPVLIGPTLYRRWDWKLPLAGFATIVVLYLPYISAGKKLLGYSAGYSTEEHLSDGLAVYPWLLAKHIVPGLPQTAFAFYWPLVALALLSLGLISAFRERSASADICGAFLIATTFSFLMSPHYIWYVAWLVPFLCFYPWWSVIWLTGAATFMNNVYWPYDFVGGSMVFLPFLVIAVCEFGIRLFRERRKTHGDPVAIQAG